MKNGITVICLIIASSLSCTTSNAPINEAKITTVNHPGPDVLYGELFEQVQLSGLYPDSKTFVDIIPKASAEVILADYNASKNKPEFDLKTFVTRHFDQPPSVATGFKSDKSKNADQHITALWSILARQPGLDNKGSIIPIPYSYVVPGGRFREIYYWDSYFTMLGLEESNRWDLIEDMVDNFSYLIDTVGFIPNGARTYFLGRSQPPFYSLMVELLAKGKMEDALIKYRPQLLKEYEFWMDGSLQLTSQYPAHRHVVLMPDGSLLNRYWDDLSTPRPEAYKEDTELAKHEPDKSEMYRHIRAGAESGWDYSSRWLRDGKTLGTIHTTEIIPVDLNALIYHLERVLSESYRQSGDTVLANKFSALAKRRLQAVQKYCWSEDEGFFKDYDFVANKQTNNQSLAAMYPLFFNMATYDQSIRVAKIIEKDFLKPGGVTTTTNHTGQQWDAPNGWAPLQWIAIQGLRNYNQNRLANLIKDRWVALNVNVYHRTGKMVEKYNVYDMSLEAGGGEYPVQDGFGWTNGVLLKLLSEENKTLSASPAEDRIAIEN